MNKIFMSGVFPSYRKMDEDPKPKVNIAPLAVVYMDEKNKIRTKKMEDLTEEEKTFLRNNFGIETNLNRIRDVRTGVIPSKSGYINGLIFSPSGATPMSMTYGT